MRTRSGENGRCPWRSRIAGERPAAMSGAGACVAKVSQRTPQGRHVEVRASTDLTEAGQERTDVEFPSVTGQLPQEVQEVQDNLVPRTPSTVR